MGTVKTCSKSGELVSFMTPSVVPVRSLKVHFTPIQEGSGTPAPDNIRTITGWTGVDVYKSGKNLFEIVDYNEGVTWYKRGYNLQPVVNTTTGEVTLTGVGSGDTQFVRLQSFKPGTYTFSFDMTLSGNPESYTPIKRMVIRCYDSNNNHMTSDDVNITGYTYNKYYLGFYGLPGTFTVPNTVDHFELTIGVGVDTKGNTYKFSNIQLEYGTQTTTYEPYQGSTIPVSFGENGTIYGGYVDLISGELVKQYEYINLDSITWDTSTIRASSTILADTIEIPININTIPNLVCEKYKPIHSNANLTDYQTRVAILSDGRIIFYYDGENLPSGGMAYKLATPITYQLTPQQLQTFKDRNNIWSNADLVEVEYDLAESAEIRECKRRMFANTPHIVSTSGSFTKFSTDLKSPLKSLKVYFSPIQSGSGDPSPTNVRPITGTTGLTVNHDTKTVTWNQLAQPITSEYYKVQSTTYATLTFNNGEATSTIIKDETQTYQGDLMPKTMISLTEGHVMYVRQEIYSSTSDEYVISIGRELAIQQVNVNEWTVIHGRSKLSSTETANAFWGRPRTKKIVGDTITSRNLVLVDLTKMFGYGNEPTLEQFESQCALNGINLSEPQSYNTGTEIPWKTASTETHPISWQTTLGGNLFDISTANVVDGWIHGGSGGGPFSASGGYRCTDFLDCTSLQGQTITLNHCPTGTNPGIAFYDSSKSYISGVSNNNATTGTPMTATVPLNASYYRFTFMSTYIHEIQIELGSQATPYKPYGGSIYGGYLDLVTGKLVNTWTSIDLGLISWNTKNTTGDYNYFYTEGFTNIVSSEIKDGHTISWFVNKLKSINNQSRTSMGDTATNNLFTITQSGSRGAFVVRNDNCETVDEFREWIKGTIVVFKLQNPITYQLTPEQVKTFLNQNIIWANTNGNTEVLYWTH